MNHQQIPTFVLKYFWGDNLNELGLQKNSTYMIQTLLEKGDQKAIRWLFSTIGPNIIKKTLPLIKLSKKSENFWNVYLT